MGSKKKGMVYLVGAGPGDPGLITERGKELLGRADCVLYDYLVNPTLPLLAPEGAELICVGKRPGGERTSQAVINRLLVRMAVRGKLVVRLKGGDPILFGRGAEEALHLAGSGVPFEIVPGVSSALAAPACAGIPLTARGESASVTLLTGHEAGSKRGGDVDWDRLLKADSTFVVLMGVAALELIVERFLAAGADGGTPAALIERGSTGRQRTVTATLRRIAPLARRRGIAAPAVLVVGKTVALRKKMYRPTAPPLKGMRVLVTRPAGQARGLTRLLEDRGAAPLVCPLIEVKEPRGFGKLDGAIEMLPSFDWVVFTSANGVKAFRGRIERRGGDARAISPVKICAIGPATDAELGRWGLRADCLPRVFTSRGVLEALEARGEIAGKRFLLPRSDRASREIPDGIREGGGRFVEAVAYRIRASADGIARARKIIRSGEIDVATLTSPTIVAAYLRSLKGLAKRGPDCAVIGPVTAAAAKRGGLRVLAEASVHTDAGLVDALTRYWKKKR